MVKKKLSVTQWWHQNFLDSQHHRVTHSIKYLDSGILDVTQHIYNRTVPVDVALASNCQMLNAIPKARSNSYIITKMIDAPPSTMAKD
jgi:hypothetical protein